MPISIKELFRCKFYTNSICEDIEEAVCLRRGSGGFGIWKFCRLIRLGFELRYAYIGNGIEIDLPVPILPDASDKINLCDLVCIEVIYDLHFSGVDD